MNSLMLWVDPSTHHTEAVQWWISSMEILTLVWIHHQWLETSNFPLMINTSFMVVQWSQSNQTVCIKWCLCTTKCQANILFTLHIKDNHIPNKQVLKREILTISLLTLFLIQYTELKVEWTLLDTLTTAMITNQFPLRIVVVLSNSLTKFLNTTRHYLTSWSNSMNVRILSKSLSYWKVTFTS
jgi:hypothetical protein